MEVRSTRRCFSVCVRLSLSLSLSHQGSCNNPNKIHAFPCSPRQGGGDRSKEPLKHKKNQKRVWVCVNQEMWESVCIRVCARVDWRTAFTNFWRSCVCVWEREREREVYWQSNRWLKVAKYNASSGWHRRWALVAQHWWWKLACVTFCNLQVRTCIICLRSWDLVSCGTAWKDQIHLPGKTFVILYQGWVVTRIFFFGMSTALKCMCACAGLWFSFSLSLSLSV